MAFIDFDDLDLNTRDGRNQAKQHLIALGKKFAIDEVNRLTNAALEADETEGDRIENIGNLLAEIDVFEKKSGLSEVEITQWDDIPDSHREWLIPQWLPANTVTMFTGQGGAGKSWLTLQAVCQIACGFNGAYLDPDYERTQPADYDENAPVPKHVIFATYEDEPAEIKRRLYTLASGMDWIESELDTIKRHVHIVDMRGIGSVWGPGLGNHIANTGDLLSAGEDLREICEVQDARLLVMDPLSGAFGGNENDRTAVYDFVSSFRGWGDTAKCAMLIIGHLPKGVEGRAAGFSGSTAWEASARSMWLLGKKEPKKDENMDEYWALSHTKSNYAPLHDEIPLIKTRNGWWRKAASIMAAIDGLKTYQEEHRDPQEDTDNDGYEGVGF